jgi:hypothetical protein
MELYQSNAEKMIKTEDPTAAEATTNALSK